jgi:hypothetical protein
MLNLHNLQQSYVSESLNTFSPVLSKHSVTNLSNSNVYIFREFGVTDMQKTSTLFIILSFSDTENDLLFKNILYVAMFKEMFYKINEKI